MKTTKFKNYSFLPNEVNQVLNQLIGNDYHTIYKNNYWILECKLIDNYSLKLTCLFGYNKGLVENIVIYRNAPGIGLDGILRIPNYIKNKIYEFEFLLKNKDSKKKIRIVRKIKNDNN